MSAVWLNVMFIKMKLGHLYLLYMYIEVGNKMRIFDFYTILLSIIMTMRTKCWNQNWNHESCHFDVVQPCRFVYVLEMFNVVQMKKKIQNEETILFPLNSYTCVDIFCQQKIHNSQDHSLSSKVRAYSDIYM